MKNTDQEFFENWSKEQLQEECARLNQVLADCLKNINRFLKILRKEN